MSWVKCSIGDVCEVFDGPHATPPKSDDGPLYLGITSIREDGSIDYENSKRISYEDFPKWTKRVTPQQDDVVFSYEANLESYAIIPQGFEGCLGRRMAIMRPDKTRILPRYLYYYMFSRQWKETIAERTVLGATVNRIPIATYPEFPIEVPNLDAQEAIINVLGAYDDLIENNRRQIQLLEEAAQRLYREWFVDLRFPGHDTIPITNGLPEGWVFAPFFELVDIMRGRSYKGDEILTGDQILLNLGNMASFGGWRYGKEKPYSGEFKEAQLAYQGDLVMAVTEQSKERRLVGHVALVPEYDRKTIFSMDLIKLLPKEMEKLFLYGQLRFSGLSREISFLANGTNILHLRPDSLKSIRLLNPTLDVQEKFSDFLELLVARRWELEKQIFAAQEARDRLLPKLMSGEIEV